MPPFTTKDANKHKKGMTAKQARQWAHVANSAYNECIKGGGDPKECEGKAIQRASGVVKKQQDERYYRDYGKQREDEFVELGDDLKEYIDATIEKWTKPIDENEDKGNEIVTVETDETEESQESNMNVPEETLYLFSEAVWTAAFVNNLPDSSFAVIMGGGKKDEEGKTTPRSLRKLPYKDADGKVDIPHLRNALARLKQMKGVPDALKAKAMKTLQAAAKKYLKSYQEEVDTREGMTETQKNEVFELAMLFTEFDKPLGEFEQMVRDTFRASFKPANEDEYIWVRDVFIEHPKFGNAVVASFQGMNYLASFEMDEDEQVTFAGVDTWKQVELTWQFVEEEPSMPVKQATETEPKTSEVQELAEVEIKESDEPMADIEIKEAFSNGENYTAIVVNEKEYKGVDNRRAPLKMEVEIIQPGFGNSHDNNYYPKEMLALPEVAKALEGVKMYTTDHRDNEKSERTEVAVINKVTRYTPAGAPVGEVTVFDPDFAEKTRNRAESQKLHTLECSIAARGKSVKGEVNGKKANIVKEIDEFFSVDFVTRAGAGGKTVGLLESKPKEVSSVDKKPEDDVKTEVETEVQETETQPEETVIQETEPEAPPKLSKEKATEIVNASTLPKESKERLLEVEYADEANLKEVITKEIDYVVKLTKSGKPFETHSTSQEPIKTHEERIASIGEKYGVKLGSINKEV